jgi:hypothetical protein
MVVPRDHVAGRQAEADLLAARILEARGRLPEALSAYERLCATYPGEEAKGRMALLLQRTGAEQRARAIFAEIRKSIERGRSRMQ